MGVPRCAQQSHVVASAMFKSVLVWIGSHDSLRRVRISSLRFACVKITSLVVITAYILGYGLIYKRGYCATYPISGWSRMEVRQPALDSHWCNRHDGQICLDGYTPPQDLPYCCKPEPACEATLSTNM